MVHVRRVLRIIYALTACTILAFLSLLSIHQLLLPSLAHLCPSLRIPFYDLAVYGAFPVQSYHNFPHSSAAANLVHWIDGKCSEGYILAALNGPDIAHPGPSIFTPSGELIWTTAEYGIAINLRLQQYRGSNVLTFWAGEKAATSGKGSYYIVGQDYQLIRKIDAVGEGLHGDLHEFTLTPDNTAILTVYNTTLTDLSGMGWFRGRDSWLTNSLFQEIDLDSGELLFQWSAADHFDPKMSYMGQPFSGFRKDAGFDSFHINSVDKHPETGGYLLSSRHTHTISLIDGGTGEVLWILGGENNEFDDLSFDNMASGATKFAWQHDARFVASSSISSSLRSPDDEAGGVHFITLFDNQKAGILHQDAASSRALLLRLDSNAMTAEILQSYTPVHVTLAGSQGSVQILPSSESRSGEGKVVVGWGASAMYTQHDLESGEVECEVHFAASVSFPWERVKSYRISKIPKSAWTGRPTTLPAIKVEEEKVYVSWEGATEIVTWELHGRPVAEEGELSEEMHEFWLPLSVISKTGFEDLLVLPEDVEKYKRFKVVGLDAKGAVLGTSERFEITEGGRRTWLSAVLDIFSVVIGICAAGVVFRRLVHRPSLNKLFD